MDQSTGKLEIKILLHVVVNLHGVLVSVQVCCRKIASRASMIQISHQVRDKELNCLCVGETRCALHTRGGGRQAHKESF